MSFPDPAMPIRMLPEMRGGAGMTLNDSVYDRLLRERIVFLGQPVDDPIANQISAQLLLLAAEDPKRDIHLYINSPGGSVTAGMAIYDTMQLIPCDIATTCVGLAASMGSLLLAAGTKGKRFILPNSRVMIHQGSAGFQGTAADIEVQAREILRIQKRMQEIYAYHTGKPEEQIARDLDRDFWMGADESIAYGIVDQMVGIPTVGVSSPNGSANGTADGAATDGKTS